MSGTAIVTGASGGIGRAVARRLAHDGFAVVVGYAGRANTAEETVTEIVELGGRAAPVQADVASAADVERLFRTAMDTFGPVDVVVHCAGSSKGDDEKARQLVRAASQAGARHLVYISVVGADKVPMAGTIDRAMFGYFGAKRGAERVVAGSGLLGTAETSDSRSGGGGSGAGTGVGAVAVIAIGEAGAIEELGGGRIWRVRSTAAPATAIASAASVQCLRDPRSAMRSGGPVG